jgi:hypothetical protein
MIILFWVPALCTGKMFQYFGMSENLTTTQYRNSRKDHHFIVFLWGLCTVHWLNVPSFWNVRESNHYTAQKPKRPLSDKPEKLINAFSHYKIRKHFEVAESNWHLSVTETVFPTPESQLQPNTSIYGGSVYSESRLIFWDWLVITSKII